MTDFCNTQIEEDLLGFVLYTGSKAVSVSMMTVWSTTHDPLMLLRILLCLQIAFEVYDVYPGGSVIDNKDVITYQ